VILPIIERIQGESESYLQSASRCATCSLHFGAGWLVVVVGCLGLGWGLFGFVCIRGLTVVSGGFTVGVVSRGGRGWD